MNWQIDSIIALQQIGGLTGLMKAFTFLGREEFFLLLIPLVYLCVDTRIGIRLGVLLLLGDSLNFLAKLGFHAPRPYWVSPQVQPLAIEGSYGLPSSHAQNAVSVWFFFAALLKRPWAWIVAACIIVLVSLSRVYLGVHFWTDIFGGWLIGLVFLLAFWRFWPRAEKWFLANSLGVQILAATAFSLLLLLVGWGIQTALAGVTDPPTWTAHAAEARSLQPLVSRCGALFGLGVGWALSSRWLSFDAGGSIGQRLARFGIGLVGVLVCWKGLQEIFPGEPGNIELLFRFLRYGILSLWITLLAPALFLKLRLAAPAMEPTTTQPSLQQNGGVKVL